MKLYNVSFRGTSFKSNHDYISVGENHLMRIASDNFDDAVKRFKKLVTGKIEILSVTFLFNC